MTDPTEYLTAQQEEMRERDEEIRDKVRREVGTLEEYYKLILNPVLEDLVNNKVTDRVLLYLKRMGYEAASALHDFWHAASDYQPPDPLEADEKFRAAVEVQADEAVADAQHDPQIVEAL